MKAFSGSLRCHAFSVTKSVNEENYIDKASDVKASSQILDKLFNHDAVF